MATPDEILRVTGYKIGAIAPFTLVNQLKTFIDMNLLDKSVLYVGAGKFGVELTLKPENLAQITEGDFVEITKEVG